MHKTPDVAYYEQGFPENNPIFTEFSSPARIDIANNPLR